MATETKKVPKSALRLRVAVDCKFAAAGSDGSKKVPVSMLARTDQPIEHPWWGKIVHDMSGMKLAKDVLPIDYCHYDSEVLGYLDKFDTSKGGLTVSGALVPFQDTDRASEVIFKGQNGVPYEASIDFGGEGIRLEELAPNAVATVNGYTLNGPAVIVREWPLRGVAICPYGADMNTSTQFKDADKQEVSVSVLHTGMREANPTGDDKSIETQQSKQTDSAANTPPVTEQPKLPTQQTKTDEQQQPKPGAEFVTTFGDVGARWFLEGKTFSQCATDFIASQKTELEQLKTKVTELTNQLAELPRGNDPVKLTSAPKGDEKPLPKGVTGGAAAAIATAMSSRKQA